MHRWASQSIGGEVFVPEDAAGGRVGGKGELSTLEVMECQLSSDR